jgi:hypothetical protein
MGPKSGKLGIAGSHTGPGREVLRFDALQLFRKNLRIRPVDGQCNADLFDGPWGAQPFPFVMPESVWEVKHPDEIPLLAFSGVWAYDSFRKTL